MFFAQYVDDSFTLNETSMNHLSTLDGIKPISSIKLYRTLGAMEINRDLFRILCYVGHDTPHFLQNASTILLKMRALYKSNRVDIFYLGNRTGTIYICRYMPCYKTCSQCLCVIQRRIKHWLIDRKNDKMLNFALGLHSRLGENSSIMKMKVDILILIDNFL